MSRLLIALAIVDWTSTVVIVMAASTHRNVALTERALTSVILSIVATCAATLGLIQLGYFRPFSGFVTVVLVVAFVLVSVPQIVWAISLLTGRFK